MPIPAFQEIALPFLQLCSDGDVHTMTPLRKKIAQHFHLTEAEEAEMLPSGMQSRLANRVAWAKVHLERAGLLVILQRGHFQITDKGRGVLANSPSHITVKYLMQFPEYRQFKAGSQNSSSLDSEESSENEDVNSVNASTPEEILDASFQIIKANLASDLLMRVKMASPQFFEQLVVQLLLKMGYGSAGGKGEAIGKSGDEGIDGIISEDRLGLEMVFLQAKRWDGTVGRPEIQKFVGALHGQRAKKGVFITTGIFSSDALNYVRTIDPRVALIDGEQLAQFMIDYNVGVSSDRTYEIKKLDTDYFEE